MQRACWALNNPNAEERHVQVTRKWLAKTGCVARAETSYLNCEDENDLMNIGSSSQRKSGFDRIIEGWIESLYRLCQKVRTDFDVYE
jgi:hypothetical protein